MGIVVPAVSLGFGFPTPPKCQSDEAVTPAHDGRDLDVTTKGPVAQV